MSEVIREVEKLAGKILIHDENLPPEEILDWDSSEEIQDLRQLAEQVAWDNNSNKTKEPRPLSYQKKRPPKWMVDRGVKTAIVEVQ